MKEILKKTAISSIVSAVLAIIIGLIFIIKPDLSLTTIGIVTSCYIILQGIILIIIDIKAEKYCMPIDCLIPGILSIILGAILIGKPELLSSIFGIVIGIWIIFSSINYIRIAIAIKKEFPQWFLILILGILDLIAGVIVVFNPFEAMLSFVIFAGIMIIVHSIVSVINMIILMRKADEFSKIIETKLKMLQ